MTLPPWAMEQAAALRSAVNWQSNEANEQIARALVEAEARGIIAERERCAEEANGVEPEIIDGMSDGAVSIYCRSRVDAATAIRKLRSEV